MVNEPKSSAESPTPRFPHGASDPQTEDVREDKLMSLLVRWDEARERGEVLLAEDLCPDCPELIDELRVRMQKLAPFHQLLTQGTQLSSTIPFDGTRQVPASYVQSMLRPPKAPGEIGRLAHYRVLGELGRGGMGIVFLAEDLRLARQVALKVMLPQCALHGDACQRFLREARLAALIESDHLVTILDVGVDCDVAYYSMPVLKGETLDARLRREGALSTAEIIRIAKEVCQALVVAHGRGMVHRDLKPQNLWLEAPSGRVKILDFGLARMTTGDARITASNVLLGTPAYMAPEQASRQSETDGRADLFSLGCVLYQAATGERPFLGDTLLETIYALACTNPLPPHQKRPGFPALLSACIMRLLEKDPARRPASAAEANARFDAVEQELTSGTRSSSRQHEQAFRRRWKTHATMGTLGLVAAAVIFAWRFSGELDSDRTSKVHPDGTTSGVQKLLPSTDRLAAEKLIDDVALILELDGGNRVHLATGDPLPQEPFHLVAVVGREGMAQPGVHYISTTLVPTIRQLARLEQISDNYAALGPWTDADLEEIANGSPGKSIKAFSTTGLQLSPETVSILARLPRLNGLGLSATYANDEMVAGIGTLTQLTYLRLNFLGASGKVSDKGWKFMAAHPVSALFLYEPVGLQRRHLQWIVGNGNREKLLIRSHDIHDEWMEDFASSPKLKHLALESRKVTDKGIQALRKASRLMHLDLRGCPVTLDGVRNVSAFLPRCILYWEGGSMQAGKELSKSKT